MAKYRKTSLVEAEQFLGHNLEIPYEVGFGYYLNTKQGKMEVNVGDFIITNPDGERYPCNAETFKETYEKVD